MNHAFVTAWQLFGLPHALMNFTPQNYKNLEFLIYSDSLLISIGN